MSQTSRPNVDHLLTWVDREPHHFLLDLFEHGRVSGARTIAEFKPTILVTEGVLAALGESSADLSWATREGQPFHRYLQVLFLCRAVPTLFCAHRLGVEGFIDQAMPLVRMATEGALRVLFLELHQAHWESALMTAKDVKSVGGDPSGRRQFNATNLLEQDLQVPSLAKWLYGLPSKFAHANTISTSLDLRALRESDFSVITPYPRPPAGQNPDDWYGLFVNNYQLALLLQVLLHQRALGERQSHSTQRRVNSVVAGLSQWIQQEGNALANLVPEVERAVSVPFPSR